MRAELNATQSPLTMSKFAQHERSWSLRGIADCCFLWHLVSTGQKKPPSRRGLHFYGVVAWDWSKTKEFCRNAIQAVVSHHLEDDVDQHPSNVDGSYQCQASPELLECCWGLIVNPRAGSVGHQFIVTFATLAEAVVLVQYSSLTFISAREGNSAANLS